MAVAAKPALSVIFEDTYNLNTVSRIVTTPEAHPLSASHKKLGPHYRIIQRDGFGNSAGNIHTTKNRPQSRH